MNVKNHERERTLNKCDHRKCYLFELVSKIIPKPDCTVHFKVPMKRKMMLLQWIELAK